MTWSPCLIWSANPAGEVSLGHPDVDDYLAFVGARARPNTLLANAYDLKVFFWVVGKEPAQVAPTPPAASWAGSCKPTTDGATYCR